MTNTENEPRNRQRSYDAPERARLEDLSRTGLLDTPPEERFDRITRLAQQLFGVSAASVSLIAENRQYLKSFVGTLARGSDVRTTIVDGHVLVHDGVPARVERSEVIATAREAARELATRAGV